MILMYKVDLKYGTELSQKLGAELVVVSGKKHFSGPVDNEESCVELPQALDAVVDISRA
ncbi:MAG: hypothetical protein HQ488_04570 [Parcubacteria group bacterium]|nr:hypothetical protein [Parcubacteria group bacterium]